MEHTVDPAWVQSLVDRAATRYRTAEEWVAAYPPDGDGLSARKMLREQEIRAKWTATALEINRLLRVAEALIAVTRDLHEDGPAFDAARTGIEEMMRRARQNVWLTEDSDERLQVAVRLADQAEATWQRIQARDQPPGGVDPQRRMAETCDGISSVRYVRHQLEDLLAASSGSDSLRQQVHGQYERLLTVHRELTRRSGLI
jgi:hypothetical protein